MLQFEGKSAAAAGSSRGPRSIHFPFLKLILQWFAEH